MKYTFTFNEINRGRIEVESDHEPDNGDIIESIMEGKADYNDTDFVDFQLVEVDGIPQGRTDEGNDPWSLYLRYLRDWADSHADPGYQGTTPACYDEWLNNEHREADGADDSYDCCLHGTPRTFGWCEDNCERYSSCDTVAWAADETNEDREDKRTNETFMCGHDDTLRTFEWCEHNCDRFEDCETITWASGEFEAELHHLYWKKFKVTITETLKLTVDTRARNREEAEQKVSDYHRDSRYVLDADNFAGVEFTAKQEGESDQHDGEPELRFDPERQVAIVWDVDDVLGIRPDLTPGQAMEVLRETKRRHDADTGVSWMTLEAWAQELFPVEEVISGKKLPDV